MCTTEKKNCAKLRVCVGDGEIVIEFEGLTLDVDGKGFFALTPANAHVLLESLFDAVREVGGPPVIAAHFDLKAN